MESKSNWYQLILGSKNFVSCFLCSVCNPPPLGAQGIKKLITGPGVSKSLKPRPGRPPGAGGGIQISTKIWQFRVFRIVLTC